MAAAFALIATLFVVWLVLMPIIMDKQQSALEPNTSGEASQPDISGKVDQSENA